MAKVPKRRRIKPGTVLIKRCIKSNTKNKTFSTLYSKYQKLKINNHALAKALSQEKQENQLLFSRNVELVAEQQNLIFACNQRDNLIKIMYRNAKNILPMIVDMSKCTTDTIAECQNFNSNLPLHRVSTSSTGRRESTKRLSMKSPARGVVKPMVSGHTITKPVINLSRVNLSVITEGPATPERNHSRSVENRRSRVMPERIAINDLRTEDPEERVIVNRRTSRFSSGRMSSGRYSKRDSGRLSGSIAGRRSSIHAEILKSPRVALQDVSRYMANNQSINVRTFSETTNGNVTNNVTAVEDTEMSESQSSPETPTNPPTIIPETQESAETSESDAESSVNTIRRKHSSIVQPSQNRKSQRMESELIDPMEGPSWMYASQDDMEFTGAVNGSSPSSGDEPTTTQAVSPVSSLSSNERRRSSACFRIPEMPKGKTKRNLNVGFEAMSQNGFGATTNGQANDDDDDEEDDDQTCPDLRRFITQRRGPSASTRGNSSHYGEYDDDDVDDEDTMLLNIRRPLQPLPQQQQRRQPTQQFQQPDQPESMPFDINELLELTPLKPLKTIMAKQSQAQNQVDVEPEVTATIQLTQRFPLFTEPSETICRMSTVKMTHLDQQSTSVIRCQESERRNGQDRRFSELTTTKINGNINLPRLTDAHDATVNNQSQLLDDSLPVTQKRKRAVARPLDYTASDIEEDLETQKQKKLKQRKKKDKEKEKDKDKNKDKDKDQDPSSAKVVLQKLNESQRSSTHSERKNSDESMSSVRSSGLRVDQSSDSESAASKTGRPRRQKAPKNLQEPSLSKKLRR